MANKKSPRRAPAGNTTPPPRNPAFSSARLLRLAVMVGLIAYLYYRQQQSQPNPPPTSAPESEFRHETRPMPRRDNAVPSNTTREDSAPKDSDDAATAVNGQQTILKNQTLRDRDGEVVFRGDVDLTATLARIRSGTKLSHFDHDGVTFENREQRLPRQARSYYHEWVHPTPKLSGPGPQRVISGEAGEFWYTADHYHSFTRIHVANDQEAFRPDATAEPTGAGGRSAEPSSNE